MNFPFPVVLGDIGGTNARFALAPHPNAAVIQGPSLKTTDFSGLEQALAVALQDLPARPRSMIAAAAGPVEGRHLKLTNAHWTIDGAEVAKAAGLEQGLFLNDFEAQALSLPVLPSDSVRTIGPDIAARRGTKLILGPGTGLGAGALVESQGRYVALASEAGHMDLGPIGPQETAFWPYIDSFALGRVVAETLLSGSGIARLHRARLAAEGHLAPSLGEADIVAKAIADKSGEEAATLRLFWAVLARVAGDLALVFLAEGGVTLAGGILPRIVDFLDPEDFRARFENKPPYGKIMRGIGTRLIMAEHTIFEGLAAIAARPEKYDIDYASRAWLG